MRPRHHLLIAVILALGIYNIYRARHAHPQPQTIAITVPSGPVPTSPAWTAFDKAAALRDAPEEQFNPALQSLQQTLDSAANDATVSSVKGCQTWLLFYRQGVMHPSRDTSWKQRSTEHLDTCVKTHQDAG